MYCYDNVRLNLAFEMMARNKNVLTYVSETHFETVKVIDVAKSV